MSFKFPPKTYEIRAPRLVIRTALPQDAEAFVPLLCKTENLPMGETQARAEVTVEKMVERLGRWKEMASQGKNAFLAIASRDTNEVVGYMGFNCFRTKEEFEGTWPERDEPLPGVEGRYLTDLGVVIDYRQRRKGYSTEVLCAAIDFAFGSLGCQIVRLETGLENEPWRALMKDMGFGDLEEKAPVSYGDHPMGWLYKVDLRTWLDAQANLKSRGKWPL